MEISIKNSENKIFYYSSLFYDYIFNFNRLCSFYTYDYRQPGSFLNRKKYLEINYDNEFRRILAPALAKYNLETGCGQKTLDNIEKLKSKDCFAVTAGQQPVIFTGSVFSIYKAITVLSLCSYLNKELNVNTVPVFWVASDDNDINEIETIKFLSAKQESLSLDIPDDFNGFSYSRIKLLINEYEKLSSRLVDLLPDTEFKIIISSFFKGINENIKKLSESRELPQKRLSVSKFFSFIFSALFKEHGLILIDPEIKEIKNAAIPIAEFNLARYEEINKSVNLAGEDLVEISYHSQLKPTGKNLDFYINTENGREKIKRKNEKEYFLEKSININENKLSLKEVKAILKESAGDISYNVILRPLLQDHILPNLATVSGPGETSYFAQLKEVYELFDSQMPIIFPRISASIFENKIQKIFKKNNIDYESLEMSQDDFTKKIIAKKAGFNENKYFLKLEESISKVLISTKDELENSGIEPGNSFNRINSNIKKEIEVLKKRIISEYKNKNTETSEAVKKIYANILPQQKLQERVVSIFEIINKYGFDFIDEIFKELNANDREVFNFYHKIIELK